MNLDLLKKIIESSSSELASLDVKDDIYLEHFRNARRSYFLNDVQGLKDAQDFFEEHKVKFEYANICADIFKVRYLIRAKANNLESQMISSLEYNYSPKYLTEDDEILNLFLVELLAVEAICHDIAKDYDVCFQKNKKASQLAKSLGLDIKASVLNYNGIVAVNHKEPAQLRICHLVDAIQLADSVGDYNTQIAALTSLAQEYEYLDCYNLAFEECVKAVALAKTHCFGSFNFCYVLLTSAKLGALTGRLDIAKENITLVETFAFNELKDRVITVRDLLEQKESEQGLSGDEQKIIQLLTDGPKDKYYLIENLYGQGDVESFENRFKQLLLRVRKKKENLISFNKKNSVYELSY